MSEKGQVLNNEKILKNNKTQRRKNEKDNQTSMEDCKMKWQRENY